MYFDTAVQTIAEIGAHGDHTLPDDEFDRDDHHKRVEKAASALCDWVFEYLMEAEGGGEYCDMGRFKQEHLPRIARMVAVGMMMQFEHDQKMEGALVEGLLNKETGN
jgi:hypothetical protein